ncbi:alpha/beta hydrolase [Kitasatospora sp. NPDC058218]|uniref:alpha/beta hydrolase n=1 Tax=Kitasatospora sp. NPDC058218 TaxID=3346385 RepID=UPI0036DA970F
MTTAATSRPSPAAVTGSPSPVWEPAAGVAVRGTVLLLPGRGEHPGVYARFGRRLAFDGYRVVAQASPGSSASPVPGSSATQVLPAGGGGLPDLAGPVAEARVAAPPGTPVVLAGSDTGALLALAAARQAAPDGLLLVGLPTATRTRDADDAWTDELGARTSCPAHRGLLATDPDFRPGALGEDVPAALAEAAEAAVPGVPALVVHGAADPVSPPATARRFAGRLAAELVLVADGRHDALNDATHRSVAAAVVQWLERLRGGPHLPAQIVTDTTTASTDADRLTPGPPAPEGDPA